MSAEKHEVTTALVGPWQLWLCNCGAGGGFSLRRHPLAEAESLAEHAAAWHRFSECELVTT